MPDPTSWSLPGGRLSMPACKNVVGPLSFLSLVDRSCSSLWLVSLFSPSSSITVRLPDPVPSGDNSTAACQDWEMHCHPCTSSTGAHRQIRKHIINAALWMIWRVEKRLQGSGWGKSFPHHFCWLTLCVWACCQEGCRGSNRQDVASVG